MIQIVENKNNSNFPKWSNNYSHFKSPKTNRLNNSKFNQSTTDQKSNNVLFCPFCEHCNNSQNEMFNSHLRSLNEAKTIINKGLEIFIQETQKVTQTVDIFYDQFKAYEGEISVIVIDNIRICLRYFPKLVVKLDLPMIWC